MSDEVRLASASLVSLAVALALGPAAIRAALRTRFYDDPRGHKVHARPTPYLGGVALLLAFLAGSVAMGGNVWRFWPILACAVALAVVGTVDDRFFIPPRYRVLAELLAAVLLTATGTGWTFVSSGIEQFILTALWIVGFVNAFNLMDNMDGAAASVGAVCSSGIAALAIVQNDIGLAAMMLALAGSCVGFLRYNLPRRGAARIFLGDGGSMPLGFLIAAAAMRIPAQEGLGWPVLLTAGLLLAAPTLDTLLVVISRYRRHVSPMTPGQDHLTHRLHARLGSSRAVAVTLVVLQGLVSIAAISAFESGRTAIVLTTVGAVAVGLAIVALLERPSWGAPPVDPTLPLGDSQAPPQNGAPVPEIARRLGQLVEHP